jgi:hypothetical protein
MPSVVSTGTHLLCRGIGPHRLMGAERAHSMLAVPSKIPDYGCPFASERVAPWAIIAERLTNMRGLLLHRRVLTPIPSKEETLWRRFPSSAPGLDWRATSIVRQRGWS